MLRLFIVDFYIVDFYTVDCFTVDSFTIDSFIVDILSLRFHWFFHSRHFIAIHLSFARHVVSWENIQMYWGFDYNWI